MANLTVEQQKAIDFNEGEILVSASAGSGKTFVMVERIIRLILEGKANVNNVLAVTFVSLAAIEMKEKLEKALISRLQTDALNERLKNELKNLSTASICTLHSFCNNLIKKYFYYLGIDSDFTILDEDKAQNLKNKCMEELFEDLYENEDEDFLQTVENFAKGRQDKYLKKLVNELYNFVISQENPEETLRNSSKLASLEGADFALAELKKFTNAAAEHYIKVFKSLLIEYPNLKIESLTNYTNGLIDILEYITNTKDIFSVKQALDALKMRMPTVIEKDKQSKRFLAKEKLKNTRDELVKDLFPLYSAIGNNYEEESLKICGTKKAIESLAKLTNLFIEKYNILKTENSFVDFSDLEHLSVKLLMIEEVRNAVRAEFKYVFVDEYQDINAVQEKILSLVSQNNMFMVGDVKQSIYGFRGCNPNIFSKKFTKFLNGAGEAVSLSKNFRSAEGIIDPINNLFSCVMTEKHSKVDYLAYPMQYGELYDNFNGRTTLHLIKDNSIKTQERVEKIYSVKEDLVLNDDETYIESKVIGEIINDELRSSYYNIKTGKEEKIAYKDIVILVRSQPSYVNGIIKNLISEGYPIISDMKNSILKYPEIKKIQDLLSLIDNFYQDIPLYSTMKSEIFEFTDSELIEIRAFFTQTAKTRQLKTDSNFFDCVKMFRDEGEGELKEKVIAFFVYYEKLRIITKFKGVRALLDFVITDKKLDLLYLSSMNGKQKLKRLNRLVSESEKFDFNLAEFLTHLTLNAEKICIAEVGESDGIRVMSIHGSKGLEFPVVILAGLKQNFNMADLKNELLKDRDLGFAVKSLDKENYTKKDTVLRTIFKKNMNISLIVEELRILYVAMTRAKYSLHMTANIDYELPDTLNEYEILKASCFADFFTNKMFKTISHVESGSQKRKEHVKKVIFSLGNDLLKSRIKNNIEKEFHIIQKTYNLPVKTSVTETLKDSKDGETVKYSKSSLTRDERIDLGNNYHTVFQHINFSNDLETELNILKEKQLLDDDIEIDLALVQKVLDTEIMQKIKNMSLFKEKPFLFSIKANEVMQTESAEDIIVQGIIDLLAIDSEKAIIIDYKFTRIDSESVLKQRYGKQLLLYKKAVEQVLKKKTECYLINLSNAKFVEVE